MKDSSGHGKQNQEADQERQQRVPPSGGQGVAEGRESPICLHQEGIAVKENRSRPEESGQEQDLERHRQQRQLLTLRLEDDEASKWSTAADSSGPT